MSPEPSPQPLPSSHLGAVIWFSGRMSTVSCVVNEISESGCRLSLDPDVWAPERFELVLGEGAIIEQCELVSREADEMRVRFVHQARTHAAA